MIGSVPVSDQTVAPAAWLGGLTATGLVDVTSDPSALDSSGRWAVSITFEGEVTCARFARWSAGAPGAMAGTWSGPPPTSFGTSLDRAAFVRAVAAVRDAIACGDVYQANICRVMRARLPDLSRADPIALAMLLETGNPAPYAGAIRLPGAGVQIATASPELFLRREANAIWSGPIKGTGVRPEDMGEKDRAENVMIVDLVRNDLSRVARTGTVSVPDLLALERHPGLVHLVSHVRAELNSGTAWQEILAAAFPPGSVSGAPKLSALRLIAELEAGPRGPYCGAIGWVDADSQAAQLAVGIRTFWLDRGDLCFGTGAGITWGSDPEREWEETVLKARHLIKLAGGSWP